GAGSSLRDGRPVADSPVRDWRSAEPGNDGSDRAPTSSPTRTPSLDPPARSPGSPSRGGAQSACSRPDLGRAAASDSSGPRLDLRERLLGDQLTLVAYTPELLGPLVDGDERLQRLGAVPPAEPRARHDVGVLVEPVVEVR